MEKLGKTPPGLQRITNALSYSWQGMVAAYKEEAAFKMEIWASLIVVPAAFFLDVTWGERGLMIACVLGVLLCELINSAIEAVVDLASPEIHPLAKRAKDIGSAVVLLSILITASVWGGILITRYAQTEQSQQACLDSKQAPGA